MIKIVIYKWSKPVYIYIYTMYIIKPVLRDHLWNK